MSKKTSTTQANPTPEQGVGVSSVLGFTLTEETTHEQIQEFVKEAQQQISILSKENEDLKAVNAELIVAESAKEEALKLKKDVFVIGKKKFVFAKKMKSFIFKRGSEAVHVDAEALQNDASLLQEIVSNSTILKELK